MDRLRFSKSPASTHTEQQYTDITSPIDSEQRLSTSAGALREEPGQPLRSSSDDLDTPQFRVYKRRWFGLVQLTLLNIIVSWDWLTFAPVSTTAGQYFDVSETTINWLSTAFLLAFVPACPAVMWTLNRGGPKPSIIAASGLILVGNWLRYAGARADKGVFGLVMFGQIIIGLAQPFVLVAPTRYSDMWFTERGRIGATALASLANPLGGALGQLIDPAFANEASDIPNMVLYVAIISTVATIPSLFIPHSPPTPPSRTSTTSTSSRPLTPASVFDIFASPAFHLLFWPFAVYVSAFNAISSELNSLLYPYNFSETEAGLTGALLIVVGLVASAAMSPALDRAPGWRVPAIRVLVPVIAAMYLAWIWVPQTRGIAAPYAVSTVLGAASFILLPLALELLVDMTWPVSPEVSSTICWAGGQLGGGICIIIMDSLKGSWTHGEPADNMKAGLVFLAVLCWVVVPLPMALGWRGLGTKRRGVMNDGAVEVSTR